MNVTSSAKFTFDVSDPFDVSTPDPGVTTRIRKVTSETLITNITGSPFFTDAADVTDGAYVTADVSVTSLLTGTEQVTLTTADTPPGDEGLDQQAYIAALVVMLVVGVVGNSLVIFRVLVDRNLHTPTFVVIGSLALADLMFVGVRIPIELLFLTVSDSWPYGDALCRLISYARMVAAYAASYHLVLLAVVRYYLLSRPLKSIYALTVRRTALASLCLWCFLLAALSPLLVFSGVDLFGTAHYCNIRFRNQTEREIFFASYSIFSYVIPLIFLGVFHVTKVRHIISAAKKRGYETRHRSQMTLTSIVVILLFGILLLPVHAMNLLLISGVVQRAPFIEKFAYLNLTFLCLAYFNSCVNPILYAILSDRVRASIVSCFCCRCSTKQK